MTSNQPAMQSEIAKALQDHLNAILAEEGITPELLECVMLEVAYSPVITHAGGTLDSAAAVRPWGFYPDGVLPDKFEVRGDVVDRETLKVMRLRYLLARDAHDGPQVEAMFPRRAD